MSEEGEWALQSEPRHLRQHQIIHPDMAGMEVIIAGAGMIGGWTAHALSRAVKKVHIFDPGEVEAVNTGNQPYIQDHVGMAKVMALGLPVEYYMETFPPQAARTFDWKNMAVVSAVDSMSGRQANAEWCRDKKIGLFLDGRIRGELAVLATVTNQRYEEYLHVLPSDDEVEDIPCGQEGTAYTGMFLASQITAAINQWSKGIGIKSMRIWHVGLMTAVPVTGTPPS